MLKFLFAFANFLAALALVGCASATHQTDALLIQPPAIHKTYAVKDVPFVEQEAGHCGPATLTMAMNWAGRNVTVDQIAPLVYTPGLKGTFQLDMISASRRQGMLAIPIEGMEALLNEIAGGHPVIVFENLALSWLPQWHYAIVYGYDLNQPSVTMHSGPEQGKVWDMRKFERSWKLGEYWGLVVLPPGELSASADELEHVRATAALESLGKSTEAEFSYKEILKRWPKSLGSFIGLANIAFKRKDSRSAIRYLVNATELHPQKAVVWHNLAFAYGAAKQKDEAKRSARKALELAGPDEKASYQEGLKEWLP